MLGPVQFMHSNAEGSMPWTAHAQPDQPPGSILTGSVSGLTSWTGSAFGCVAALSAGAGAAAGWVEAAGCCTGWLAAGNTTAGEERGAELAAIAIATA